MWLSHWALESDKPEFLEYCLIHKVLACCLKFSYLANGERSSTYLIELLESVNDVIAASTVVGTR